MNILIKKRVERRIGREERERERKEEEKQTDAFHIVIIILKILNVIDCNL